MPMTDLSPFLTMPLAVIFAVVGVFLLLLVRPLWRVDPDQPPEHVAVCRVASCFCGIAGVTVALLAIAYGHGALYAWGVL